MWDDLKEMFPDFKDPPLVAPAPSFSNTQGSDFDAFNTTQVRYASTTYATKKAADPKQSLQTSNPFGEHVNAERVSKTLIGQQLPEMPRFLRGDERNRAQGAMVSSGAKIGDTKGEAIDIKGEDFQRHGITQVHAFYASSVRGPVPPGMFMQQITLRIP